MQLSPLCRSCEASAKKINPCVMLSLFFCVFFSGPISQGQTIREVQDSFSYVKSTLDMFNSTGRLVKNPGIDGADLEAFVAVLAEFDQAYRKEFSLNSPMCRFYLDPNNARLTIEERADIAFSTLSSLDRRIAAFKEISTRFVAQIELDFGTLVMDNIRDFARTSTSYLQLPTSNFDEAAVISFIDSACA